MRQEEDTFFQEEETQKSVNRFEEMQRNKTRYFFDVHEFEQIIDFYFENGLHNRAYEAIRFGLSQHPDSIPLQLKKAQVLLHQRRLKQSLSLLNKIARIEYNNYEVFVSLGMVFNLLGRTDEAILNFDKAFSLEPEEKDEIAGQIAFSFMDQQKYEEAIKYFSLALQINPSHVSCLFELGNCYKQSSKYREAEKYYKRFLDKQPFSLHGWFFMGVVLKYQDRFEEALEALDFALAINDQYSNALLLKADIFTFLERFEEAIETYLVLLAIVPEDVMALVTLANCYLSINHLEEAEKYLIRAKNIDPSYSDIYYLLGSITQDTDRLKQSVVYFRKACSLDPEDPVFWYSLAGALTDIGRIKEARDALKKAIREDPQDMEPREALARLYCEDGNYVKAADILEEGFNFSEPNAWHFYFLGSYRILGHELQRGLRAIEKALELNFSIHEEISLFQPDVFNTKEVLELIEKYKNKKQ